MLANDFRTCESLVNPCKSPFLNPCESLLNHKLSKLAKYCKTLRKHICKFALSETGPIEKSLGLVIIGQLKVAI